MTTTYNDIKKALESDGYKVNALPQEKTSPREIILIMSGLDYEVETTTSYLVRPKVWIGWSTADPNEIIGYVAAMVQNLTARIKEATFVFGKPQIEILGQLYRVSITCEWKTIVDVVPPALTP